MTTLTSTLTIRDQWRYRRADGITSPTDKGDYKVTVNFADGSGSNEIQDLFRVRATLPPNEDDAYDVAGAILNIFGSTLTLAQVKQITLINRATVIGQDLVFGAGGHPTGGALASSLFDGDAGGGLRIKAGGGFTIWAPLAGYAVTGGSADILRVYNMATVAVEYDLIVKGIH